MTLLVLVACQPVTDGKPAGDSATSEETGTGDTETGPDSDTDSGGTDTETGTRDTDTALDSGYTGDVRLASSADVVIVGAERGDPAQNPVIADWNGDGALDIGLTVYQSNLGAGLSDGLAYRVTDLSEGRVELASVTEQFRGTGTSRGLKLQAAFDANEDGYDDAVVYENEQDQYYGHVAVLPGPFSGEVEIDEGILSLRGATPGDFLGHTGVVVGDTDGDGGDDLVAGALAFGAEGDVFKSGGIAIIPAASRGSYTSDEATAWVGCADDSACGLFAWDMAVADGNGDGVDDLWIAAAYAEGESGIVYLFDGPVEGGHTEVDADASRTGAEGSQYGTQIELADVDGDGFPDLVSSAGGDGVAGELNGSVFIDYGPVAGSLDVVDSAGTEIQGEAGYRVAGGLAAADVDADADEEVVVSVEDTEYLGTVYLWLDVPRGITSYTTGQPVVTGDNPLDMVWPRSTSDIDGDGLPDLILTYIDGDDDANGLFLSEWWNP